MDVCSTTLGYYQKNGEDKYFLAYNMLPACLYDLALGEDMLPRCSDTKSCREDPLDYTRKAGKFTTD